MPPQPQKHAHALHLHALLPLLHTRITGAAGKRELTRAEKKRIKAQREAEIRAAEAARLAGMAAGGPESAAEYEQQLLAGPNNSYLWIKYMAFQLKLGEEESA